MQGLDYAGHQLDSKVMDLNSQLSIDWGAVSPQASKKKLAPQMNEDSAKQTDKQTDRCPLTRVCDVGILQESYVARDIAGYADVSDLLQGTAVFPDGD